VVKEVKIKILDVYGKLIESSKVENTDKYIITKTNKAKGVYFVEIEIKEVKLFEKLVIN